jgi:hypothetical protein
MGGPRSTYGGRRDVYRVLTRKLEGKKPLGNPRPKWKYNIKTDFQNVSLEVLTGLIWLRIGGGGWLLRVR